MSENRLKVLITGVSGRVGPHLFDGFKDHYDLRTFDRRPFSGDPACFLGDLTDRASLDRAMEGREVVVHLAATPDEAPFVEDLVPNNVIGLYNTFEAAREAGVRRFVFASTIQTISCYPRETTVQITDPPRPVTLYGVTKVLGETMGRWYHDKHGMEFVGVRIGWFQPYDSPVLREKEGIRNSWLSPDDAVSIFRAAVEKPGLGYTLVMASSVTVHEFMSRAPAREALGYEAKDNVRDYIGETEKRSGRA